MENDNTEKRIQRARFLCLGRPPISSTHPTIHVPRNASIKKEANLAAISFIAHVLLLMRSVFLSFAPASSSCTMNEHKTWISESKHNIAKWKIRKIIHWSDSYFCFIVVSSYILQLMFLSRQIKSVIKMQLVLGWGDEQRDDDSLSVNFIAIFSGRMHSIKSEWNASRVGGCASSNLFRHSVDVSSYFI